MGKHLGFNDGQFGHHTYRMSDIIKEWDKKIRHSNMIAGFKHPLSLPYTTFEPLASYLIYLSLPYTAGMFSICYYREYSEWHSGN